MEDQDLKKTLKTWLPIAGLIILTLLLLFLFKNKREFVKTVVENSKDNLLSFYTDNLQPLMFKTEITNEDVFNFAVFQNLPVDKYDNKVISVGYDETTQNDYVELRPAIYNPETNNYERFVTALNLTGAERTELDSILNAYKQDLYSHVLYDDNNAIAVNSHIIQLKKAILADLAAFAQRADKERAAEFVQVNYQFSDNESVNSLRQSVRQENDEDESFIVFAPDTVFGASFDFDEDEFDKVMKQGDADLIKAAKRKGLRVDIKFNKNDVKFTIDSLNYPKMGMHLKEFRVPVPKVMRPPKPPKPGQQPMPHMHKDFGMKMDSLSQCMQNFSFTFDVADSMRHKFRMKWKAKADAHGDSVVQFGFEYNLKNMDSLVHNTLKYMGENDFHDWEQFGFKMDSLSRAFEKYGIDTTGSGVMMKFEFDPEKLEETLKEMEKEYEKQQR